MNKGKITIKGARANNLKNFDLEIPLGEMTVVTGVSGSGKSSLAFDTLYAEGQRRYVESLSAYARQFLGRMPKPECDYIKGLPPAIAVEQKVNTRNPRSTVGTSTEIQDYLRMLFARIGHTISPISGKEVKMNTVDSIVKDIVSRPENTRFAILAPVSLPAGRKPSEQLDIYLKEGYSRLEKDGDFYDIAELTNSNSLSVKDFENYKILIDRLAVSDSDDNLSRIADSVETAWYEGKGVCFVKIWEDNNIVTEKYTNTFEADGITFPQPSDLLFNFNNPYGACPECEGYGKVLGISEELVIPDVSLTIAEGAVQCFRGDKMGEWKDQLIKLAPKFDFPIHTPYMHLSQSQKDFLWHGRGQWEGIDGFFKWVDTQQHKIQYRVLKARYRGKTTCPVCHGKRLRPEAENVKVNGKSITELSAMSLTALQDFFEKIELTDTENKIGARLLREIKNRIGFLINVGLGYLTLDRTSATLSGGESQRINLATSLGSSLVGSLYILDEPSIGLHPRDTKLLIDVLHSLRNIGNTVIVVEHDEEIMQSADSIIDIGPDAGRLGGEVVFQGKVSDKPNANNGKVSYTLDYLTGKRNIPYDTIRKPWKKFISIEGACANNLKNIDVRFPLGIMTCVTGVSGSGKSTLVRDILYRSLQRHFDEPGETPGSYHKMGGDIDYIKGVEFVDQNPIGTSSRSNPATYLKAFDEIRKLFSEQPLSIQMGFTPAYFSFNAEGGRCEECKGEGVVTIPMQFMADIVIPCEQCNGKRYKPEILEVNYRGKNIFDFLEMTVDETIAFLRETNGSMERRIIKKLQPLVDVGLGYIKLGQSSSTLSGGENQRVKLAYYLSQEKAAPTIFIFDEPTTGLHFHDINTLLKSLRALVDRGHTVLIIEHNLDIIKNADYIIDMGPEGGENGGNVVAIGTPEEICANPNSITGKYLSEKL